MGAPAAADGSAELPLSFGEGRLEVPEGSASADALRRAMGSGVVEDSSLRLVLHASAAPDGSGTSATMAEAEANLRSLWRIGRDLDHAHLGHQPGL